MRRTASFLAIAITALCFLAPTARAEGKKKIIFIAGVPSHGFAQHEQNAGVLLLAKCLNEAMPDQVETVVYNSHKVDGRYVSGWPTEPGAPVSSPAWRVCTESITHTDGRSAAIVWSTVSRSVSARMGTRSAGLGDWAGWGPNLRRSARRRTCSADSSALT